MTVNDLKAFLDTLPGDMPVLRANFQSRLDAYEIDGPLMVVPVRRTWEATYEVTSWGDLMALVLSDEYDKDIANDY